MDYQLISKENGTGFNSWERSLIALFSDFKIALPRVEQLHEDYHSGLSVWDVFKRHKSTIDAV